MRAHGVVVLVALLVDSTARADARAECSTAYDAVQADRDKGQLIEARKQATVCAASTCAAVFTTDCTKWLVEIDAAQPTIAFSAHGAAGADLSAVRVFVDGQTVADHLDGKPLPLDPGPHKIRFVTEGAAPVEQALDVKQGEKNRRVDVVFPSFAAPPDGASPSGDGKHPTDAHPGPPTWAWASLGAGAATVATGLVFVGLAVNEKNALATTCGGNIDACPDTVRSTATSQSDQHNAFTGAAVALTLLGGAGIGVAIVGLVSTRPVTMSAVCVPFASPAARGLACKGVF